MSSGEPKPTESRDSSTFLLLHFDYKKEIGLDSSMYHQSYMNNKYNEDVTNQSSKYGKYCFVPGYEGTIESDISNGYPNESGYTLEFYINFPNWSTRNPSSFIMWNYDFYLYSDPIKKTISMMKNGSSDEITFQCPNVWWYNHVAIVNRNNSYFDIYIEGKRVDSVFVGNGSNLPLGYIRSVQLSAKGNAIIDEVRYSDYCRYTGDSYNVPTEPFW